MLKLLPIHRHHSRLILKLVNSSFKLPSTRSSLSNRIVSIKERENVFFFTVLSNALNSHNKLRVQSILTMKESTSIC